MASEADLIMHGHVQARAAESGLLVRAAGQCEGGNEYDGQLGLRISAIFVILVGSLLGAWFPVFASRRKAARVGSWPFFFAKFFGSGVIIATAFIHLLAPAHEALSDPCLTGPITEYPWVEAICLMTIFVLFTLEFAAMRLTHEHGHGHKHSHESTGSHRHSRSTDPEDSAVTEQGTRDLRDDPVRRPSNIPGEDHMGHSREHVANEDINANWADTNHHGLVPESYRAQLIAVFVLEFGVVFHSIFIGLTLAVAGDEFKTLYIVLVFHQTFEGLGLGSRLSMFPWPRTHRHLPYILALLYALSTPLAIAAGLGVRETFTPGSSTTLVTNGVFDSVSAGILIYTGLVELMAHEFMFSPEMMEASTWKCAQALLYMALGAGLMALLGKWA